MSFGLAEQRLETVSEEPDPVHDLILRYYFAWIDWVEQTKWAKTNTLPLDQWFLSQDL